MPEKIRHKFNGFNLVAEKSNVEGSTQVTIMNYTQGGIKI